MKKTFSTLLIFLLLATLLVACGETPILENPLPSLEAETPEPEPQAEPETPMHIYAPTIISDELQVVAMSTSLTSVLAILEDGSLWMWEAFDELDHQTWEWTLADWAEPPAWIMDNVISAVAGPAHHLAIDADGVLWAWGENQEQGKIGDGTSEPRPYPVPILEDVVYAAISPVAPNSHVGDSVRSYAITADGTLWGWGQNGSAWDWPVALGDGTDIPRSSPVWIMDNVSSVTPTREGAYAITEDGVTWWWGERWGWEEYSLEEGDIPDDHFWRETRLYPVRVDDSEYVVSGWRTSSFHYEIDESGTLWTWGENQLPEHWIYMPLIGDGTTETRTAPVAIMDHVQSVEAIADTVFVIDSDGALWAWGANNLGQLGDGTREARLSPTLIMDNVAKISTHYFMDHGGIGFMNTFVLTRDGALWRIGSLRGHGPYVSEVQGEPELLPMRLQPKMDH